MDSFTQRIDTEFFENDSGAASDNMTNSFEMVSSSLTDSTSTTSSFTVPSPEGGDDANTSPDDAVNDNPGSKDDREATPPSSESKQRRRPLYEAPEFIRRLNVFEEVDVGGVITFECQVRAFPRPVIKWYKDDVEIPPCSNSANEAGAGTADADAADRVRAEDLTGNDSTTDGLLRLVITDARKDDEGAYRCKAENEEGVAATTGYLSVTGQPQSQQQPQQHSPRINAVSTPPLLRAITEQQSMEEREAAAYVADDEEEAEMPSLNTDQSVPDELSIGDWPTYAEYLKVIDDDSRKATATPPADEARVISADIDAGSDTSTELDVHDDDLKIVDHVNDDHLPVDDTGVDTSSEQLRSVVVVMGDNGEFDESRVISVGGRFAAADEPSQEDDDLIVASSQRAPKITVEQTSVGEFHLVDSQDGASVEQSVSGPSAESSGNKDTPLEASSIISDMDVVSVEDLVVSSRADKSRSEPTFTDAVRPPSPSTKSDVQRTEAEKNETDLALASGDELVPDKLTSGRKPTPFKIPNLLRDILPASKSGIEPTETNETKQAGAVVLQQGAPAEPETAVVDKTATRRHQPRPTDVELSWSLLLEWYMGWFEYPWCIFFAMATFFTALAVATDADPVQVVLVVLLTSFVAFFSVPILRSTAAKKDPPAAGVE